MKTTFIVTSAIITNMGVYDPVSRMQQTHQTIDSIYKKFPDANVLLVEAGDIKIKEVTDTIWTNLRNRVSAYMDLTDDETLMYLKTLPVNSPREMGGPSGLIKSMSETVAMHRALSTLKGADGLKDLREVDAIFKLSGRYVLSPLCKPGELYYPGKYLFKIAEKSWIPNALENIGTDHLYQSRFWGFDAALLDDAVETYERMMVDLEAIADQDKYIDVEHLLFKHFGTAKAVQLQTLHCMGTMAPNGTMIYD